MKIKSRNIMMASFAMMAFAIQAAPIPVDAIYCDPGFVTGVAATNRQNLVYIAVSNDGYQVTGAVCTECTSTRRGGTTNDLPASSSAALSGVILTHVVIDSSNGAKFDLGVTITNDNTGIVLGEIGASNQTSGDPINVYPLINGIRVGNWVRRITAVDYGMFNAKPFRVDRSDGILNQTLIPFLTTFRHSDFTNDTGALSFDGIEINDTSNYDPNIVAVFGEALTLVTNKLPVTAMTFSPGFDENPELDGQVLKSITTDEGTFSNIEGLRCVSAGGSKFGAVNEGVPDHATNALSELRFTQGSANVGTADWILDAVVNGSDSNLRFFFGEISVYTSVNPDSVTITPFVDGVLFSDKTLVIESGDYGTPSPVWDNTYVSLFVGTMVSFSLNDFLDGVFDEPLTNVTGFRVYSSTADPNIFGTYKIPFPGTIIVVY
ncbi:MAG: hypothetical protein PF904_01580 [Kiritimatiellae bacterium]|nr:hypothetical protein [Kiritimatiellia bacterium]